MMKVDREHYDSVASGGADDDDEDAAVDIGGEHSMHDRDNVTRGLPWWQCLLVAVCSVLLATDIGLRLGMSPLLLSTKKRWVPTVDILNASSPEFHLKYLRDVQDYGLQGLAMDGDVLYEFHTMAVRKLTLDKDAKRVVGIQSSRVYNGTTDFPVIINQHVAHIGGIDLAQYGGGTKELWIATHSEGIEGEGALFAVDPDTLDIKPNRVVRVDFNLDWVAYKDGILYYGVFFNVKKVYRVQIDTLEPLSDLQLELPEHLKEGGINYVQSASFDLDGRLVLLGDDYQCTVYYIDVDSGALVGSQALLLGSEVDGITYDHSRQIMLVGYNRQHSHEQVMNLQPMVSVIRLELMQ